MSDCKHSMDEAEAVAGREGWCPFCLRDALEDALDYLPPCDEDMHPAWCIAHQTKRCDGNAVIARGRAALGMASQREAT